MIYIVIPVFNRWHFTKACLESLRDQDYREFQVVVVDHGSIDGTDNFIKDDYPEVVLLKGDESMWWTAATNLGIMYALDNGADYVLTLNNDTRPEQHYLTNLIQAAKTYPGALIGSMGINSENKLPIYGGEIVNWYMDSSTPIVTSKTANLTGVKEVSYFPGRGLLIPVYVFKRIGLFDCNHFPHYMADYDFTLRSKKIGCKILCCFDARLGTFPDASGANAILRQKDFKSFIQHLFGIKGGGNLILFYKFALRHCPAFALPSLLLVGSMKRIIGFWFQKKV